MSHDPARPKLENAREIVRLSEVYLDGMVRFSLNADLRATTLSGMLATLAAGLIAAGVALVFSDGNTTAIRLIFGVAAFVASIFFIVALWYTVKAAQPRPFHVPGNYLDSYRSEADLHGDLAALFMGQAEVYQEQINENKMCLEQSAGNLRIALACIRAALPVSMIAGFIAYAMKYH